MLYQLKILDDKKLIDFNTQKPIFTEKRMIVKIYESFLNHAISLSSIISFWTISFHHLYWILFNFEDTIPRKIMNLPYSICMYWTNVWQPTVHVQQNIFEKTLKMLVVHIFTLLLAPFVPKLVNYLRYSETLKFRKNSKSTSFSFENGDFTVFIHFSKTRCASNNCPIGTQQVPKEA